MPNPVELWEKWKAQKNPWLKWGTLVFILIAIVAVIAYRIVSFQISDGGVLGKVTKLSEKQRRANLEAAKAKDAELDTSLKEDAKERAAEHERQKDEEAKAEKLRVDVSNADSFDDINDAISKAASRGKRPS